jgi:hypothetical protein
MFGIALLDNTNLQVLGHRINIIDGTFSSISFQHVFHEMNARVDKLSKEAMEFLELHLVQEEFLDGDIISTWDDYIL